MKIRVTLELTMNLATDLDAAEMGRATAMVLQGANYGFGNYHSLPAPDRIRVVAVRDLTPLPRVEPEE